MKNEAIVIGLATVCLYLFSYSYMQGYLSYFGIGSEFISIDLTSLTDAGVGTLLVASGSMVVFLAVERSEYRMVPLIIIYPWPIYVPVLICLGEYQKRGVTDLFVILFIAALAICLWVFFRFRKGVNDAGSARLALENSTAGSIVNA